MITDNLEDIKKTDNLEDIKKTDNLEDIKKRLLELTHKKEVTDSLFVEIELKKIKDEFGFGNISILRKRFQELLREKKEPIKTPQETKLDPRFLDADLIEKFHAEIDKDHKEDHREKMAIFVIAASAELKDPNDHISSALKGDSSTGKDSAIKAVLKHFPKEESLFLTRATAASMEDSIENVKRIAFSEINIGREGGANSEITEIFKQIMEGGISVMKKDAETNYKTVKHISVEQKTGLYATTETSSDEELETRYVLIPIRSNSEKNQIVINDTLQKTRSEEYYLNRFKKTESWIAESIKSLDHDLFVIIPFTEVFEKPIKDIDGKEKYLFDFRKERIKRDHKRLLSLTKTITWLYQKQREIKKIKGVKFVYSEPEDFLLALNIFADFFNLTYEGLDHRLIRFLDCVEENIGKHASKIAAHGFGVDYTDWVLRNEVQEELGLQSRNTIKSWVTRLSDLGRLETYYNDAITNKAYLLRPVKRPISHLSLPVTLTGIDTSLTAYLTTKKQHNNRHKDMKKMNYAFIDALLGKSEEKNLKEVGKLTGQKLTGQFVRGVHTEKIHLKCSFCGETPCVDWRKGKPICEVCRGALNLQEEKVE